MEGTKEQKERLLRQLAMVINEDVLNEMDILMILQICSDACNRQMTELYEDILREAILSGDAGKPEQSGTDDGISGDSSV